MEMISAADAESRFHELLERVSRGEEIVVTKDDQPIARLVPERPPERDVEYGEWPLGVKGEITRRSETGEEPLRTAADIVVSRTRNIPAELMADLPTDGASQHDHYIYGWPKREP